MDVLSYLLIYKDLVDLNQLILLDYLAIRKSGKFFLVDSTMRIPQSPPKMNTSEEAFKAALNRLSEPEVAGFIQNANKHYYHWNEFRHMEMPKGLNPAGVWSLLSIFRNSGAKTLPLTDKDNKPFEYCLFDSATALLHEIDRSAGGVQLIDSPNLADMKNQILVSSVMDEAISTSQIEGAVTTIVNAREMLLNEQPPRDKSERMIANSYRTIQLIKESLGSPLTLDLLFKIQVNMTEGTLDNADAAGRFRSADESVSVVDNETNEVMYTPPPAELLPDRIKKLLDFANSPLEEMSFIHPLTKAAILHFWLAYEHPFVDGNGRTARALFYWYMLRNKYWLFEFISLSSVILESKGQYYRSFLQSETAGNDLTYSILYMFQSTTRALKVINEKIKKKQAEQNLMVQALKSYRDINYRQRAILHRALKHTGAMYSFQSHKNSHGISYQSARTDIMDLVKRGFLKEIMKGKKKIFMATEKIQKLERVKNN